jgi:uncharacterized protein (TIGR02594 family)
VVTVVIANSYSADKDRTASANQVALEERKFQFDVIKSALTETKDAQQRAEALQFLTDIKILAGLDETALAEWAEGKRGNLPTLTDSVALSGPGVEEVPRASVDPDRLEQFRQQAATVGTSQWMNVALGEWGVSELAGPGSSADVMRYVVDTGISSYTNDEIPWSGLFMAWVMRTSNLPATEQPLLNRNWLKWGQASQQAVFGAVAVAWRQSESSGLSTVGFYLGEEDGMMLLLSGNVGNKVDIARIPKERLLGFRLPTGFQPPN